MLIFTKKKFIKAEGKKDYRKNKDWVDRLNGRSNDWIIINEYAITSKWCINKEDK